MTAFQTSRRAMALSAPSFHPSIRLLGVTVLLNLIISPLLAIALYAQAQSAPPPHSMEEIKVFREIMKLTDAAKKKEAIEKFLSDNPQTVLKNNARLVLADAYKELGDIDAQIKTLEAVIADDPEYMEAHNRIAKALLDTGDLARAEQSSRKALELVDKMTLEKMQMNVSPEQFAAIKNDVTASYRLTIAQILLKAGKTDEAKKTLALLIDAPPSMPAVAKDVAQTLVSSGDVKGALKLLDPFVISEPKREDMAKDIDEIKELHKKLYTQVNGSLKGYEESLKKAKETATEKDKKDFLAGMIDKPGPEFSFTLPDGKAIGSAQLKDKIVIMTFWATWCRPCHMELPHFQKTYEKFKDDKKVAFLAISTDAENTKGNVKDFIEQQKFTFPLAYSSNDAMKFGYQGIPALYVLDTKGNIRLFRNGFDPSRDLVDDLTWVIEELKKSK